MAVPANSMHEVIVTYAVNAQICKNVLHYKLTDDVAGVEPPEYSELVLADNAAPGPGSIPTMFASVMSADSHIIDVSAQMVWPTRWRKAILTMDVPGTRPGTCNAQNVQASIEKFGFQANRHAVGALRVGGISQSDYQQGLLTAGFRTIFQTFVDDVSGDLSTNVPLSVLTLVIANKEKVAGSNPPKYRYVGWTDIFGMTPKTQIRTQRTRTIGKGI